jgi:8-oxo-dGTP pyrophosphatase MutT (NUDIX family)
VLHAAVVMPIIAGDEPAIVFVRRAAHLRRNPGHIGFPGGALDAADGGDPEVAALREFEEETGVARELVRVVDQLGDVVTVSLGVRVTPFLGILAKPVRWQPDAAETAGVHEVPVRAVYAPGALHEGIETVAHDGTTYHVKSWLFDHADLHVWGATARMLRDLLARYPRIEDLPLSGFPAE